MKPVILYRNCDEWQEESRIAETFFPLRCSILDICENDLVISRFSALPFYKDREIEINRIGAKLINSYQEHMYIADLKNWYTDLKDYTPETWFNLSEIPEEGPFVLKGATNSKKFNWNTHMFAKNKKEAIEVYHRLSIDGLIGSQDIYVRKYQPLKRLATGFNELPITHEVRMFCYKRTILSAGFYWSCNYEDLKADGYTDASLAPDVDAYLFVHDLMSIIANHTNFYVVDIAKTEEGKWILIELNDAQMSGLSENNPQFMYHNLILELMRDN